MSELTFVYPQHEIFEPYRVLTETAEIEVKVDAANDISSIVGSCSWPTLLQYKPIEVPFDLAFKHHLWFGKAEPPAWLLAKAPGYKELEFWYDNGSINTLSFYKLWPLPYVNEGMRIMRPLGPRANVPQANEILAYGTGVLRLVRAEPKGLAGFLCSEVIRVDSERKQRLGSHIGITNPKLQSDNNTWSGDPVAWESTNLVMPETLGELRQLSERRDEHDFIDAYFRDLLETIRPRTCWDGGEPAPESIADIISQFREVHRNHLRTGLWNEAPRDRAELIDRVDELLGRIAIDPSPIEIDYTPEPTPEHLEAWEKVWGECDGQNAP